jgi:histidine triad (HIT) family protein
MSEPTIFEKIINREIPADIVHEDDQHIVILDINPFEKGHVLVIPKQTYETIMDMPENEYKAMHALVHQYAQHLYKQFGGGINIAQNNYPEAHQVVPHVHVHIIPRNEDKPMYRPDMHVGGYSSEEEKQSFIEKLKLV